MRLGVHDLLTVNTEDTSASVFDRTKRMVQELEQAGYHRYWFAEHHGIKEHISCSPEVMAAYFAGTSSKIRVGAGGTMIMHYSPLKTAELFKTLSCLAPGRIDLGMGRAPGCSVNEILALAQGRFSSPKDLDQYFADKILDILAFLQDEEPQTELYKYAVAVPKEIETLPQTWLLGSTGRTAPFAAEQGLPYSHARFFGIDVDEKPFLEYRKNFKPSAFADQPNLSFSYEIVVADTSEEADYLAKTFEVAAVRNKAEDIKAMQDPELLKDVKFTPDEANHIEELYAKRFLIKGSRQEVQAILEEEIERFQLDELMFYIPLYHEADQIRCYKMLAEMFA
ncbi:MAG: MsnO8 family LLM class oxidoreductase [Eubacteriales bacterium]|nr:MsnO8 family LLM class oxidoreductase [Clostridiales bacterium]MDY5835837.1 MsnO8 family LLM class oxidoreductase [Eubacteriales bacterium]